MPRQIFLGRSVSLHHLNALPPNRNPGGYYLGHLQKSEGGGGASIWGGIIFIEGATIWALFLLKPKNDQKSQEMPQ